MIGVTPFRPHRRSQVAGPLAGRGGGDRCRLAFLTLRCENMGPGLKVSGVNSTPETEEQLAWTVRHPISNLEQEPSTAAVGPGLASGLRCRLQLGGGEKVERWIPAPSGGIDPRGSIERKWGAALVGPDGDGATRLIAGMRRLVTGTGRSGVSDVAARSLQPGCRRKCAGHPGGLQGPPSVGKSPEGGRKTAGRNRWEGAGYSVDPVTHCRPFAPRADGLLSLHCSGSEPCEAPGRRPAGVSQ